MIRFRRFLLLLSIAALVVILVGVFTMLKVRPDLGASAASRLRPVIGNRAVAQLESSVFLLQDMTLRQANKLGLIEAKAPWQKGSGPESLVLYPVIPAPPTTATATSTAQASVAQLALAPPTLVPTGSATQNMTTTPSIPTPSISTPTISSPTPEPSPSPTPAGWSLPDIAPFGSLAGEGLWQPYLTLPDGQVAGQRTFLQPDPDRPHTIVAVVAFDLTKVELNYVLGTEEPALPGGPRGLGIIAAGDREPGKLLAAFNGGFLATHGYYGAMSDGITALPAKKGAGTVAMGNDGRVQIGVWGEDVDPNGDYAAWRQNGSMVVHQGEINERVYNGSIATWGGNLDGVIVTWRSGLGISADGQVLYYLAGPTMSMPILAQTMKSVGVYEGILLDINPYWVHFAAIRPDGEALKSEPLFDDGMETQPDRYLRRSTRDFFYITASQ